LRALKSVLISAGNVKRERIQRIKREKLKRGEDVDENDILVAEDIPLLFSLLSDVFPGVQEELKKVCAEMYLTYGDGDDVGSMWVEKITQINHGLMMVGPSGSGKTMAWRVLLKALERLEGLEGVAHIIDPKAISKDHLYGTLDPNTREWTDGLIIDNVRGELQKRQWIIFDGDVDPEWVENLNSVLDDNKLLTLPNGERLSLPPNDLKYATLATVSRCGMVWFRRPHLLPSSTGKDHPAILRKGKTKRLCVC
uniref:ATPase dynein-related AAA domain-containing protein n=1 Tax=Oryzias latipes TaxID=8090 RepID=A0A3P9JHN6_ORYLA